MPKPKIYTPKETSDQHTLVSPEEIKLNKDYAFTLNPCDALQSWGKCMSVRLSRVAEAIGNTLAVHLHDICEYTMQMEFSAKGRLHVHGVLSFKKYDDKTDKFHNVRMFYLDRLPKIMIQYSIDLSVKKDEGWDAYMSKGSHLFPKPYIFTSTAISKAKASRLRDQDQMVNFLDDIGKPYPGDQSDED